MTHDELMDAALEQARRAREAGEVPIGAVVALGGEIVAIRESARRVGNYRLTGATLCVTIEPCLMCVGAIVHARVGTLVYGALEPRTGAVVSTARALELPGHFHEVAAVGGIAEEECRALLQEFFRVKRRL